MDSQSNVPNDTVVRGIFKFFFHPSIPSNDSDEFKKFLTNREDALLALSENEDNISHVIYPELRSVPDVTEPQLHVIQNQPYLDESKSSVKIWHVYSKWLQDSAIFNKWMNESSYEVKESDRVKFSQLVETNKSSLVNLKVNPSNFSEQETLTQPNYLTDENNFNKKRNVEEVYFTNAYNTINNDNNGDNTDDSNKDDSGHNHMNKKRKEEDEKNANEKEEDLMSEELENGSHDALRLKLTRKGDAFLISKAEKSNSNPELTASDQTKPQNVKNPEKIQLEKPFEVSEPDPSLPEPNFNQTKTIPSQSSEIAEGEGIILSQHPLLVKQTVLQPHLSVIETVNAMKEIEKGGSEMVKKMEEGKILSHEVENISQMKGENESREKKEEDEKEEGKKGNVENPVVEKEASKKEPQKMDSYSIPAHAAWFTWSKIHPIEIRSFPEFFNNHSPSKTPHIYKDYRDYIINRYRQNPNRPINFTEIRRSLIGDVNSLQKIFAFLENWGLINFGTFVETSQKSNALKWPGVSPSLVANPPAGMRIVSAHPSPSAKLYRFGAVRDVKAAALEGGGVGSESGSETSMAADLVTRKNRFASSVSDAAVGSAMEDVRGMTVEYHCDTCGIDCSKKRYHCPKLADYDVCPACFSEGKFNPGMSSSDFIRMDAPTEPGENNREEWSDQETLLLLEALEIYGDNWNEITEHVATKTKAQCILHFIRMPIEDDFIEEMKHGGSVYEPDVLPRANTESMASESVSKLTEGLIQERRIASGSVEYGKGEKEMRKGEGKEMDVDVDGKEGEVGSEERGLFGGEDNLLPFGDASNPVMAQVAFLAAMVSPRVASAAAQAALQALTQEDSSALHEIQTELAKKMEKDEKSKVGAREVEAVTMADTSLHADADVANGVNGHGKGMVGGGAEMIKEEKREGKGEREDDASENFPSSVRMRAAAATALAASAVKAKLMADKEEREIQRLVANIVENQMKKIELKLKHFDDLEIMLLKEKNNIERQRQLLMAERIRLTSAGIPGENNKSVDVTMSLSGPSSQAKENPHEKFVNLSGFQPNLSSIDLNANAGLANFQPHI